MKYQIAEETSSLSEIADDPIWLIWRLDSEDKKRPVDPHTGRFCDGACHDHAVTLAKAQTAASKYKCGTRSCAWSHPKWRRAIPGRC